MTDREESEFRSIGCEIICHPDVAEEITARLREAVAEILDDCSEDEIADHGVG